MVFINRQRGSGTRLLIDQLIEEAGVDHQRLEGYQTEEFTHAAVAAYVGSGMADAGFGVEPPARQFNLDFIPIAKERYFLICRNESLDLPEVQELIELLRGPAFRELVAVLPGYTTPRAGEVASILDTFSAAETRK
jgi:molybdate-binding protein